MSSWPVTVNFPTTIENAAGATLNVVGGSKVPSPLPSMIASGAAKFCTPIARSGLPSSLKSAWTIEYMPLAPTLLPATERIAGELNTGRGTADEADNDCDAGGEVALEILTGAGR